MDHTHQEAEEDDKLEMVVYDKWYEMNPKDCTIIAHSTPGLLIRTMYLMSTRTYFMSLTQSGQIQISDFTHNFRQFYWSGCNGFMLETLYIPHAYSTYTHGLMITNPATNQRMALPPIMDPTQQPSHRSAIAYLPARKEYKVVATYWPVPPYNMFPSPPIARVNCAILTVGVDNAWRLVDTQHLSLPTCQHFNNCPLLTEGFVHWLHDWSLGVLGVGRIITTHRSNNFILTLNMETETFSRFPIPRCVGGYYYYKYFSSGGSNLSLLIGCGYLKWNVWELKPETGEWTKLPDINLEAHKGLLNESYDREEEAPFKTGDGDCLDCKLIPAGWLKYRDVVVFIVYRPARGNRFRQARLRVVYNVQTRDIISLLMLDNNFHPYLFHRNNQLIIPAAMQA